MARYKDEIVTAALQAQLQPGEELRHFAYGVKQPNIGLIILLVCLAVLPGLIAVALLTKEFVIGLTDRRFLVLRVSGGKCKVSEVLEYALNPPPPAVTSTGAIFTHIKITDPQKPFVAKFHRAGMAKNREHSMAIAAVLSGKPSA
jgi:hypothetical protein